ncbi:hypothetical protein GQX74_009123 [Glossina fuscipes]|nr:hypothetical protein GQX74_009123 [Glossina fuscipes]
MFGLNAILSATSWWKGNAISWHETLLQPNGSATSFGLTRVKKRRKYTSPSTLQSWRRFLDLSDILPGTCAPHVKPDLRLEPFGSSSFKLLSPSKSSSATDKTFLSDGAARLRLRIPAVPFLPGAASSTEIKFYIKETFANEFQITNKYCKQTEKFDIAMVKVENKKTSFLAFIFFEFGNFLNLLSSALVNDAGSPSASIISSWTTSAFAFAGAAVFALPLTFDTVPLFDLFAAVLSFFLPRPLP